MLSLQNKTIKTLFFFGVASFFFVGFLGFSHFSMNMGMDGKMSMEDCPFMIGSSICTMTPFEHISMLQSLFTNIPHQNTTLVLLLLASALTLVFFWIRQLFFPPKNIFMHSCHTSYSKYIPTTHIFQELFSNGILNPKTF